MNRLAILGAGGHGKVAADIAECLGWSAIEFFDDSFAEKSNQVNARKIIGSSHHLLASLSEYDGVFVAVGNNSIREKISKEFADRGANLVTLSHPSAVVSTYARIGVGSIVMPGAVVNVDSIIGNGAIINTCASIDHDCIVGNYVHIGPGAHVAGDVMVRDNVWIGVGASIKNGVTIGSGVTVGAGAVVINDIADDLVVVGVPARPLR